MPAEFQRLNKLIIFWLRINALHFSLSLPALRLRCPLAVMPVTQAIQVASP
jgi:hypothetical protein